MSRQNLSLRMVLSLNAADFIAALRNSESALDVFANSALIAAQQASNAFAEFGLRGVADIEAEIQHLADAYQTLADSGLVSTEDLARAEAALQERTADLNREMGRVDESTRQAGAAAADAAGGFGGLAAGLLSLDVLSRGFDWLTEQIGSLMEMADAWANVEAKLKLVTTGENAAAQALSEVQGIAQQTASDLSVTGDLYATLSRSLKSLGDNTTRVGDLTRTIAQTFQISGASAAGSAGAITQLAQALSSGVLRGDEFNSVMEQAPRLAQALADQLNVTTGQLRAMAEEGKLTAQAVIGALSGQSAAIAAEAATLPDTFERSTTRLKNSLTAIVGGMNEALKGSDLFAVGTRMLSDAISALAASVEWIGQTLVNIVMAFSAIPAPIYAAIAAIAATGAALALLSINLAAVIGYLGSLATGLTLVALAGFQSFIAAVGAAGAALSSLWALALANPLTALLALAGTVAAGFMAFSAASQDSADSLAKLRDEIKKAADELAALQRTLATAKPGSDDYAKAQQRLAQIVPGLTLSLDAQGRVIAATGEGFADNAQKIANYAAELKKTDQTALLRQLSQAYSAHQDTADAVAQHTQTMREQYGIGENLRTGAQELTLWMARLGNAFAANNAQADALATTLSTDSARLQQLSVEALNSGLSIEQIAEALNRLGASQADIAGISGHLKNLTQEANKSAAAITAPQLAAAEAAAKASEQTKAALEQLKDEIERLDGVIDDHRGKLTASFDAERAGWQAIGAEVSAVYQDQIDTVNRATEAKQQAIADNLDDERKAASARVALTAQDTRARLAATASYQAQALKLIDQESDRRKTAARAAGESEKAIEQERLQAKRDVLKTIEADYQSHIDQLNAVARQHLDEVTKIEDQIRALKLSTEDRIREIQRGTMTDQAAYADRQRQVEETASAARRALAAGDFEQAQTFAKKTQELAAQLNREVKDDEKVYVSKQQAAANATKGILAGAALEKQALEGLKAAHQKQADGATQAANATEAAMEKLGQRIEDLTSKLAIEINLKLSIDQGQVNAEIGMLEKTLNSKDLVVKAQTDLTTIKADLDKANELVKSNPLKLQARLDDASAVLERLKTHIKNAGDDAPIELKTTTQGLEAAITVAKGKLSELGKPLVTPHTVTTNAPAVVAQVKQLDQLTTISHHEITGDPGQIQALTAAERDLNTAISAYQIAATRARDGDRDAAAQLATLGNAVIAARANFAALAQAKTADAEASETANAAHVTYGEWVKKSGDDALAAATNQSLLASAVGESGEKVRALSKAYAEAQAYNARTGGVFDAAGAANLKTELDAAKQRYDAFKSELALAVPPVTIETDTAAVDEAKIKVESIDGIQTYSQHEIDTNADQALSDLDRLDGHDTSSTHTVYVREVTRNALGGLIRQFAAGGAVSAFPIPRWSTVPGSGNADSVPAALEPGSFVLKKAAARYYGSSLLDLIQRFAHGGRVASLLMPGERLFLPGTVARLGAGFFDALNGLRLPREALAGHLASLTAPVAHFAQGGTVAAVAGASDSVNINLQIGRQAVQLQGARAQASALAAALQELQRGR